MPQDLTRRIALRHSVDMLRVTMEFFEEVAPLMARSDEQLTALTVGILKYSRDLAFSAATAYADAAEARGSWDSRMEASVVDAVVRGDTGPELLSRAAALNWDTTAPATVVVGTPAPGRESHASQDVRDIAIRHGRAALTDVHGTWLVAIVSGQLTPDREGLRRPTGRVLRRSGGDRPDGADADRCLPQRQRSDIRDERRRRLARCTAPVLARELLPERALMGDASAVAALHTDVMRPLADAGPTLTQTFDAYLDCGGAIEACARALFVHPNTVRYRLRRIADFTGRDPTQPRDAYVLRVAATVGHLTYQTQQSSLANNIVIPVTPTVEKDLLAQSKSAVAE